MWADREPFLITTGTGPLAALPTHRYYYNARTKESVWVKPNELEEYEKMLGLGEWTPVANACY